MFILKINIQTEVVWLWFSPPHIKIKTMRNPRGLWLVHKITHSKKSGDFSLSCFSDLSSLLSSSKVTCCKGQGFGEETAVVLGNKITYDFISFPTPALGLAQVAEPTYLNIWYICSTSYPLSPLPPPHTS